MQYVWNGPRAGLTVDYDRPQNQAQRFKTLADLTAATGAEAHGVEVDYDIFVNVRPPSPPDSSVPSAPYEAADLDFRLKPASKAIDAGQKIANVNEGFAGAAPDLGAYEAGQTIPVYGPRGATQSPFYR
jgi:hypothetical protein